MNRGVSYALGAAALFGASTPFAKLLLGEASPWVLAALLYLGSGIGLAIWIALRARLPGRAAVAPIPRPDWPWLAAAIAAGGVAGPVLLMQGLARTDAASASLLLNLEAVLTAAIAWTVFRENVDRRVFAGMVAIIAGGVLLSTDAAPRAGGRRLRGRVGDAAVRCGVRVGFGRKRGLAGYGTENQHQRDAKGHGTSEHGVRSDAHSTGCAKTGVTGPSWRSNTGRRSTSGGPMPCSRRSRR
jgi:uncharacterized membrane protein